MKIGENVDLIIVKVRETLPEINRPCENLT